MKKLLSIVSFATTIFSASIAPAYSQQLTLEQMVRMTGGNQAFLSSLQTQYDTRGALFNAGGQGVSGSPDYYQQANLDQMIRMRSRDQAHPRSLQTQYDTRAMKVDVGGRGEAEVAQYGYRSGSAGNSVNFGNQSTQSYDLANGGKTIGDYYGETTNQRPYSRGGLWKTNTAVQSLEGEFGNKLGRTSIPSGNFKYGFGDYKERPYRGVSGNKAMRGSNLPSVSTASVDIDIVNR